MIVIQRGNQMFNMDKNLIQRIFMDTFHFSVLGRLIAFNVI